MVRMRLALFLAPVVVLALAACGSSSRGAADRRLTAIAGDERAVVAHVEAQRGPRPARCSEALLRAGFRSAGLSLTATRGGGLTTLAPREDDPPFFLILPPIADGTTLSVDFGADTKRPWGWGRVRHIAFGADTRAIAVVNRLIRASC
jgi:hypothetical protein